METQSASHGTDLSATQEAEALLATLRREVAEVQALAESTRQAAAAITTAQAQVVAAAGDVQSKLAEIVAASTAALAARNQITDEQAVIATKSAHIEDAKTHADDVRAELDKSKVAATSAATEAEGASTRAQAANESAGEILTAIKAHKAQADTELTAAVASRDAAKAAAEIAKGLAERADSVETRVAEYEAKLADFEARANQQLATITGLLPGATSAGLAHAFDQRRQSFLKPGTRWQWLFVGSVGALVLLAATGLWQVVKGTTPLSYDDLLRLWLARLPIAGALIWLALHASRESALAKRLEEDYGYKAAIAASFQGFQEQMGKIGGTASDNTPLGKLCDDTLATLASPPGRIYDKHKLTVSPAGELASAARTVTDVVGDAATGKAGKK